jgi:glycosyltransferase involved in cell wall biosynthesis
MVNHKLSVVTVVFNGINTLEETILSVLNQTYKDVEYIIIDGGSTDGTVELIEKYKGRLGYWISEPDKGIYDAMNKALSVAKGDWLIFLGADDVFYNNNVVENAIKHFHLGEAVYYGDVVFRESGRIYDGRFSTLKMALSNICHQAIFYPNRYYKENKYDLKYKMYADHAYNISLFRKVKFIYIDLIITVFCENGFSSSRNDIPFERDRAKLVRNHIGWGTSVFSQLLRVIIRLKNRMKDGRSGK